MGRFVHRQFYTLIHNHILHIPNHNHETVQKYLFLVHFHKKDSAM